MTPVVVSQKKDFMLASNATNELSESSDSLTDLTHIRRTLGKFERSKILEIYFARLDGRIPDEIPVEYEELYQIELNSIKKFLLGQYPQDNLLQRLFKIMH